MEVSLLTKIVEGFDDRIVTYNIDSSDLGPRPSILHHFFKQAPPVAFFAQKFAQALSNRSEIMVGPVNLCL